MDGLVARLIAGRSGDYRVEDADKTRAATEISCQSFANLGHGWMRLIESNCVAASAFREYRYRTVRLRIAEMPVAAGAATRS